MQVGQAVHVSPIYERIDEINKDLCELREIVQSLKVRLTPVRIELAEKPPSDKQALAQPSSCPLDRTLLDVLEQVKDLRDEAAVLLGDLRI